MWQLCLQIACEMAVCGGEWPLHLASRRKNDMQRRALRLFGCVMALTLTLGTLVALSSDAGSAVRGSTWYVDCSAGQNGTGTLSSPFNELSAANRLNLGPGDRLLFRRGAKCAGMLAPQGSGSPGHPIVIGSYGPGRARAKIYGYGRVNASVWLADMSYVTVQNLEVTNAGDTSALHRGIYFTSRVGLVRGITIRNLLVQHVNSDDSFSSGKSSGGIVGDTLSPSGRFSGVLIENNRVRDVSRQGITIYGTTSSARPSANQPWPQASTGVIIRGNSVVHVQGDGIVPLGTNGAVVEQNAVRQGNLAGRNFSSPRRNCSVGIWAWDANNTVIEHNEVSDFQYGPSTTGGALDGCDGEAFDVDSNQDGTVIEYNYSHNNVGGFVLLCTSGGTAANPSPPHHADVRFNLSVDDNATFNPSPCSGDFSPTINNLDGIRLYNNTIVAATPRVTLELKDTPLTGFFGSLVFANNIVVATSSDAANHPFPCGTACSHNLFYGMPPPPTAVNAVTQNPQFLSSTKRGAGLRTAIAFKVKKGSPAVGAGAAIAGGVVRATTQDFFGNAVRNPPTIGFSEK
jgi:hypothetical protein